MIQLGIFSPISGFGNFLGSMMSSIDKSIKEEYTINSGKNVVNLILNVGINPISKKTKR